MSDQSDQVAAEADPAPDQSDRVKPWTIKGITPEVRNAAIAAANRADQAIGEWLSRAIRNQIQSDHQVDRSPVRADRARPENAAAGLAEVAQLVAMAKELSDMTGTPPPKAVSHTAYGLIRDRLKAIKAGPTEAQLQSDRTTAP